MSKNITSEEERNELAKQMVENLMAIAEMVQRPIKYFKANNNGVFSEIGIDSPDLNISTK